MQSQYLRSALFLMLLGVGSQRASAALYSFTIPSATVDYYVGYGATFELSGEMLVNLNLDSSHSGTLTLLSNDFHFDGFDYDIDIEYLQNYTASDFDFEFPTGTFSVTNGVVDWGNGDPPYFIAQTTAHFNSGAFDWEYYVYSDGVGHLEDSDSESYSDTDWEAKAYSNTTLSGFGSPGGSLSLTLPYWELNLANSNLGSFGFSAGTVVGTAIVPEMGAVSLCSVAVVAMGLLILRKRSRTTSN